VRERGFILWFVVIVVLVALLNLDGRPSRALKSALREILAPIQEAVAAGVGKVTGSFRAVRDFSDVAEQNERMAVELVQLRNENLTLRTFEQENIQLREQLQYARTAARDLVPCEVIGRDVSGWWQTVRLGQGYLDRIETGLAVVTPDGLVGRTLDSTAGTTDVLLISDPTCRVSVQVVRSGTFGIMSGSGPPAHGRVACRIDFLNRNAAIREGDEVVTSGLGGIFPKGLLVGYIETVQPDDSGLAQTARVLARSDLSGLTHVFVVVEEQDEVEDLLLRRSEEPVTP